MLEGSPAIQQQSGGPVPTCLLVVFPCSTRLLDSTKPLSANLSSVLLMQQLAMLSCVFQQEFFSLLLIHRLIDHIYGKSFCFDVARARWLFNLMLNVLRSFKKHPNQRHARHPCETARSHGIWLLLPSLLLVSVSGS